MNSSIDAADTATDMLSDLPNVLPQAPFFKTTRGFNISVTTIARRAQQEGVDCVRRIGVPSRVRVQRRRGDSCDTPSLSEVGGGDAIEYCQVIAGSDGRPVPIDNVLFVNSDPQQAGINHATAAVSRDTIFALGWRRHSDRVILIYRIDETSELVLPAPPRESANTPDPTLARLDCELIGHSIDSWRGQQAFDVPDYLVALHRTTAQRLTTDWHAPLYMDVFRMKTASDASAKIASQMRQGLFGPAKNLEPERFMVDVMNEIFDVRRGQYARLPSGGERRAEPLHAVETIELNTEDNTITVELVIPRSDDAMPEHFRTVLTPDNYIDHDGRLALERGLVLRMPTFDRLQAELADQQGHAVEVNLTSLR